LPPNYGIMKLSTNMKLLGFFNEFGQYKSTHQRLDIIISPKKCEN